MTDTENDNDSTLIIPSNPADRKKIKDAVIEISGAMQFIEDKKSYIKDVLTNMNEQFKIPKKVLSKMAKTYHNNEYSEVICEAQEFETAYELIMAINQQPPADNTDED